MDLYRLPSLDDLARCAPLVLSALWAPLDCHAVPAAVAGVQAADFATLSSAARDLLPQGMAAAPSPAALPVHGHVPDARALLLVVAGVAAAWSRSRR